MQTMQQPVAVMDLGTNVFHLLIARASPSGFEVLVHLHEAVKLGEGGINKNIIQPAAFERGLQTMRRFHQEIVKSNALQVKAIGTSALRNATNASNFAQQVKALTGISIEIVDGDAEAAYIYQGIRASGCLNDTEKSLIIDIGGGSVEFILADSLKTHWKESFEVGAARMMDLFHKTDPISPVCIADLTKYLDEKLAGLFTALKDQKINALIGSAGAFETFAGVAETRAGHYFQLRDHKNYQFDQQALMETLNWLIASSHTERLLSPHIPPVRVDMIVVSSVLTQYIIQTLGIGKVFMSTYSLKEGVLAEALGF
jgi:exopolyphosphatase/guanosine-5'-triphosphate,3'-diphosphate pyrophosphatase